jgi:hypothetical protein
VTVALGALIVAAVALAVAAAALVYAVLVGRQSAKALGTIRRHRLAHGRAHGTPDPEADTPPRGVKRYDPPTGHIPVITAEQRTAPPTPRQDRTR